MLKLFVCILCCFFSLNAISQVVVYINAGSRANYGSQQELMIDNKGACRFYISEVNGPVKDSSSFKITANQLDSIFRKADQVGFFSLNAKYESGAVDGAGIYVSMNSSGKKHSVHLVNTDQPAIKELVNMLNAMLASHRVRIYYGQDKPQ